MTSRVERQSNPHQLAGLLPAIGWEWRQDEPRYLRQAPEPPPKPEESEAIGPDHWVWGLIDHVFNQGHR